MSEDKQSRTRPGQESAEQDIAALREKGGPFVAAVEATRMPMVVTDPKVDGNPIIYANAAFLELCGYDREDVLGQNYLFLAGADTDPETAARIETALTARETLSEEMKFYRKDGTPIWVAAFVSPVVEGGRVVQHFASFLDITRRVELERRLVEANETLERRVVDRTRRLDAANARLEEEVRYRTFLASEIDHRTKNALQLAMSLLQIQVRQSEDAAVVSALQAAMERLGRMVEIQALLYQRKEPVHIDFTDYLGRLVHHLHDAFQPAPGQVEIRLDAEAGTWGPDLAIPLALIVSEAVINALKHAFPGGRKGSISVSLRSTEHGKMRLVVEDDGVGLPSSRREGSLGLQLIEAFASQIKGTAGIGPAHAQGTCVAVLFPAGQAGSVVDVAQREAGADRV